MLRRPQEVPNSLQKRSVICSFPNINIQLTCVGVSVFSQDLPAMNFIPISLHTSHPSYLK